MELYSLDEHRKLMRKQMGVPSLFPKQASPADLDQQISQVHRQYTGHLNHDDTEAEARVLARLDALAWQKLRRFAWKHTKYALFGCLVLALLFLCAHLAAAQQTTIRGVAKGTTGANSATVSPQGANSNALDVNIVAGGAGGGVAQLQVRNAGDTAWVNVGFNVANLTLPVTLQTSSAVIGHVICDSGCSSTAVATQAISALQLPSSLDIHGWLRIHEQGIANVSIQNSTLAVTDNLVQFGGNPVVTGTGVGGLGIPRVTVSSDSFPLGFTNTDTITGALPAGTNNIGTVTVANLPSVQQVKLLTSALQPIPTANQTPVFVVQLSNGTYVPVQLAEGQAAMAQSLPVTLASDQPTLATAMATLPPGTNNIGAVTVANFPAVQSVKLANNSLNPVPVFNQAPMQVYAALNGVLTPVQLIQGQAQMAQSLPVTIASNQSSVPVSATGVSPMLGLAPSGTTQPIATDQNGVLYVRSVGMPLLPCNPVRTTNCQHF